MGGRDSDAERGIRMRGRGRGKGEVVKRKEDALMTSNGVCGH